MFLPHARLSLAKMKADIAKNSNPPTNITAKVTKDLPQKAPQPKIAVKANDPLPPTLSSAIFTTHDPGQTANAPFAIVTNRDPDPTALTPFATFTSNDPSYPVRVSALI